MDRKLVYHGRINNSIKVITKILDPNIYVIYSSYKKPDLLL